MGPQERAEADRQWNSVETKRLRAIDAAEMGLAARLAAMDKAEADAKATAARAAELAKPATADELKTLDTQRTVMWFKKTLGRDDLGDLAGVTDEQWKTSLRGVPTQGWPEGDDTSHLRALRTAEPEPVVEIEPEPDNTGLHRLLEGKV